MSTNPSPRHLETEARIRELRESLGLLEAQLQREIEREQHDEIEHLDRHFDAVESKLVSLKTFWSALKEEFAGRKR